MPAEDRRRILAPALHELELHDRTWPIATPGQITPDNGHASASPCHGGIAAWQQSINFRGLHVVVIQAFV
jgi:hypothetical protein